MTRKHLQPHTGLNMVGKHKPRMLQAHSTQSAISITNPPNEAFFDFFFFPRSFLWKCVKLFLNPSKMIKVPVEEEELLLCAVRLLDSFLILYTTAATSSLSVYSPHLQRASFCHFHPAASLFISATFTLTSLSVFSLLLLYV